MDTSRFLDIWTSFNALPVWVRIWVAGILAPINMASLLFINEEMGVLVSFLAIIAMLPNVFIMLYEKGLSKLMALPHLIPWTVLVYLIIEMSPELNSSYGIYLWLLAGINTVSLLFDFPDSVKWLKGDRSVA
jgi:CDP-diglyceride synthetase